MRHLLPTQKIKATTLTNQRRINLHLPIRRIIERIVPIRRESEQTLLISNLNREIIDRNHVTPITTKGIKEKYLLANNVATLVARNEVRTPIIDTRIVVSKMVINTNPSIQTWARLLLKTSITKPSAIHRRSRAPPRQLLRQVIADVTFVTTQIILLMLAHRKAKISSLLKTS
jgi:hypothetical protein